MAKESVTLLGEKQGNVLESKQEFSKNGEGFNSILSQARSFLIKSGRQLVNVGLVVSVVLALTIGVMAQSTTAEVNQTGNLSFTTVAVEEKTKTQEQYYADSRTIAVAASDFSAFALGEYVEVNTPKDLPESSLAVVDEAYLVKPNITITEIPERPREAAITYTVKDGDTIISIASKFGINTDTILWANTSLELTGDDSVIIKPGKRLRILPVNGVYHVVSDGETLAGIAAEYKASVGMIRNYNNLDDDKLEAGKKLIIPDGKKEKLKPIEEEDEDDSDTQIAATSYSSGSSWRHNGSGNSTYYSPGNRFPYGYCTWYAASRAHVTWPGNAWAWYGNAAAQGRAVGQTPVAGAIMVSWESSVGHVAVVDAVYGNGTFRVSEMNYAGFGVVSSRVISIGSFGSLIGFIY